MRVSSLLFWGLAAYLGITTVGYVVWGLLELGKVEWTGGTAFGLTTVLSGLIAFYLGRTRRAQGGELPEDLPNSAIEDGDPELGSFSPWSWWPALTGLAAGVVFLGLAIGPWLAYFGAALVLVCLVGWAFEYYRGYFGR